MPKPSEEYNLQKINPAVAKQWHPSKNGSLKPNHVAPNTTRKVWWLCERGHEWRSTVNNRNYGHGCPICSRLKADHHTCLKRVNPILAKEWHPEKNGDLTTEDVTPDSGRNVWWQCKKGHEWSAPIFWRNKGLACPYCKGIKVSGNTSLLAANPLLAQEWHPRKNGKLTPKDVSECSGKKVWWICQKGHEYQARISHRSNGGGCPVCRSKKIHKDNCLQTRNPRLAQEWHPVKNGNLTPKDVMPFSRKKVWWRCDSGHGWEAAVFRRSSGRGCPYCKDVKKRK